MAPCKGQVGSWARGGGEEKLSIAKKGDEITGVDGTDLEDWLLRHNHMSLDKTKHYIFKHYII